MGPLSGVRWRHDYRQWRAARALRSCLTLRVLPLTMGARLRSAIGGCGRVRWLAPATAVGVGGRRDYRCGSAGRAWRTPCTGPHHAAASSRPGWRPPASSPVRGARAPAAGSAARWPSAAGACGSPVYLPQIHLVRHHASVRGRVLVGGTGLRQVTLGRGVSRLALRAAVLGPTCWSQNWSPGRAPTTPLTCHAAVSAHP